MKVAVEKHHILNIGLLLFTASLVAMGSRRLRLPYSVGLVVAGAALAASPWKPELTLSRDLIFEIFLPPLVFEDRSMIVTRYAGCVQAASFVEFGDPDAPADPSKWARLERHIAELGLPLRAPFERWMGARPTLPDYLPAIGRSARTANLIYAFGHQHLGLTLAPITGEIVAALVAGNVAPVDLAPFDLERFA